MSLGLKGLTNHGNTYFSDQNLTKLTPQICFYYFMAPKSGNHIKLGRYPEKKWFSDLYSVKEVIKKITKEITKRKK